MPSLQLDVAETYDLATKRALARGLGAVYAEVMGTEPDIVTVVVRDLGAGGVWRCTAGEPVPAALLMCDVRRGRPAGTVAIAAVRARNERRFSAGSDVMARLLFGPGGAGIG